MEKRQLFKAIKELLTFALEFVMGIKLVRSKKWYGTLAGASYIVGGVNQLSKAVKTFNELENKMYDKAEAKKSEVDGSNDGKIQMGFCVDK